MNDLQVRRARPQGQSMLLRPIFNISRVPHLIVHHGVELKKEQFSDADRSYVGTAHRTPDISFECFSCRSLKCIAKNIISECQGMTLIDMLLYMPPNG